MKTYSMNSYFSWHWIWRIMTNFSEFPSISLTWSWLATGCTLRVVCIALMFLGEFTRFGHNYLPQISCFWVNSVQMSTSWVDTTDKISVKSVIRIAVLFMFYHKAVLLKITDIFPLSKLVFVCASSQRSVIKDYVHVHLYLTSFFCACPWSQRSAIKDNRYLFFFIIIYMQ